VVRCFPISDHHHHRILQLQLQFHSLIDCNLQEDLDTIDRLIADAEASYNKWRHPDPYIGKTTTYEMFTVISTCVCHCYSTIL